MSDGVVPEGGLPPPPRDRGAAEAGTSGRVLSIQSHVVSGYVGNKAAVLPLQLLGFSVDPVNSVQFSNHTGYPVFKSGGVPPVSGESLEELVDGLRQNGLLPGYTHMLTGYIGSASLLRKAVAIAREISAAHEGFEYVCDPVMGDWGRLYVPEELVEVYRDVAVPAATVLTPNQFEIELLAGTGPLDSLEAAARACDALHARGPHTVVVTSMHAPGDRDDLLVFASTTRPQGPAPPRGGDGRVRRCTVRFRRLDAQFTGTGDLLSALLLAWLHKRPGDLEGAVTRAVATAQQTVRSTMARAGRLAASVERSAEVCRARELRLVENIPSIVAPPVDDLDPPIEVSTFP